jgi:hypothetical protein
MSILTGENPFYRNKEQLDEGAISNQIRDGLETLQQYWFDNKERFLDKEIYPILERPFDKFIIGGIMVLGINHATNKTLYDNAMKSIDDKILGNLYDKKTKTWLYFDDEKLNTQRKRVDDRTSQFLGKQFVGYTVKGTLKKRPSNLSQDGSFQYQAAFNKILEKLGLESLKPKLYAVEIVPFGSPNTKNWETNISNEMFNMSFKHWFTPFFSLAKPKLIFCPLTILEELKKRYPYTEEGWIKSETYFNKGTAVTLFKFGFINGIPVIATPHWSGSYQNAIKDPLTDEYSEYIRDVISSIMGVRYKVSDEEKEKYRLKRLKKEDPVAYKELMDSKKTNTTKHKPSNEVVHQVKKLMFSQEQISKFESLFRRHEDYDDLIDEIKHLQDGDFETLKAIESGYKIKLT